MHFVEMGHEATWGGNETENQDSFPTAWQSSPGCRDVFCSPDSGATPNLVPLFLSDVSGWTAYFGECGWSQNDSWYAATAPRAIDTTTKRKPTPDGNQIAGPFSQQ